MPSMYFDNDFQSVVESAKDDLFPDRDHVPYREVVLEMMEDDWQERIEREREQV